MYVASRWTGDPARWQVTPGDRWVNHFVLVDHFMISPTAALETGVKEGLVWGLQG